MLVATPIELVSKELTHLAAILHVYVGSSKLMKEKNNVYSKKSLKRAK